MAKRKPLEGVKCRWEPQPVEEGLPMPGTALSRGSRVAVGRDNDTVGTVLGLSDSGQLVGVKFDDSDYVTEYTIEQFADRFGGGSK